MAKFALEKVVMTRGVATLLEEQEIRDIDLMFLLNRHVAGDWGDTCKEEQRVNDFAVNSGDRILSSYKVNNHTLWLNTEGDRSYTTVFLPEEY